MFIHTFHLYMGGVERVNMKPMTGCLYSKMQEEPGHYAELGHTGKKTNTLSSPEYGKLVEVSTQCIKSMRVSLSHHSPRW